MNEQQIPVLAAKLVEHQSAFDSLPIGDAQWIIENTKEAIALFVGAVKNRLKQVKLLLGPGTDIITMPDRAGKFTVSEDFAKYRGSNFDTWFIGRVEEPVAGAVLRAQPILRSSADPAIIEELGGNLKARITLADIDYAKKSGVLRKDCVYVGYVEKEIRFPADETFSYDNEKGEKCVLRAVLFGWLVDGWGASASSFDDPREWHAGCQVLSRIPVA